MKKNLHLRVDNMKFKTRTLIKYKIIIEKKRKKVNKKRIKKMKK